jgi:hypothetical protein
MNTYLAMICGVSLCFAYATSIATAQEVDLGVLSRNRAEWPKEVTLKEPLVFPITVGGEPAGEAEIAVGERVRLLEVFGLQVVVEHGGVTKTIPTKHTDLVEQIQARIRAREQAAERARQQAEAEQKAFEQESQQKVLLDGRLVERSSLKIEKLKGTVREKNSEGTTILLQVPRPARPQPVVPRNNQAQPQPAAPAQPPQRLTGGRIVLLVGYTAKQEVGQEIEVEAVPKDDNNTRGVREFKVVTPPTFEQWKLARGRQ